MAENRYLDARAVSVRYRTDPAVVERVLPPGLKPAADPVARAEVVDVGASNCVGSFAGGGLYVRARHGDRTGEYCLAMPMSTDAAITWGRELFGEPKKRADVSLSREGTTVTGRVSRRGTEIIGIDAEIKAEREADPDPRTVFHYRAFPDVAGRGFRTDPTLVGVTFETDLHRLETGTGSLSLGHTEHDPLAEIAVREPLGVSYTVSDLRSSQEVLTAVDPEAYLPYAFGGGRVDDPLTLDTAGHPDSG